MKCWQEMANEEMRRLVAASDGLLAVAKAGAPAEAAMKARDSVCDAVVKINAMLKKDAEARAKAAEAEAKAKAEAESGKGQEVRGKGEEGEKRD